jgi:hypothetical protein
VPGLVERQLHPGAVDAGVSGHVGHRLQDHPVGHHLHRRRQLRQLRRPGERHVQRPPVRGPQPLQPLAQRAEQAQLVEGPGAQPVDDPADLGDGLGRVGPQRPQLGSG